MGTEVIRQLTEEEWILRRKKAELNSLEMKLAQRELELTTLRGELQSFQSRYLVAVGSRYWELDDLEALIAEAEAALNPENHTAQKKAEQARAQAEESAKTARNEQASKYNKKKFKPTEALKKLYREIAKRIHPDLATDNEERVLYQQLMAKANKAYQAGDEVGLQNILKQGKKSIHQEHYDEIEEQLIRIGRQINQIKERLTIIELETEEIKKSSLYQLKQKVESAETKGINLLNEMIRYLEEQIIAARIRLDEVTKKGRKKAHATGETVSR